MQACGYPFILQRPAAAGSTALLGLQVEWDTAADHLNRVLRLMVPSVSLDLKSRDQCQPSVKVKVNSVPRQVRGHKVQLNAPIHLPICPNEPIDLQRLVVSESSPRVS